MKKLFLLATSVAMTLAMTTRAEAAIQFDPTGGGCASVCYNIDVFDPTVGNSISLGLNANSGAGTVGTLLFQANLGIATLNGSQQYANGENGAFFTFAAAFQEKVTFNTGGPAPTLVFGAVGAPGTEQGTFRIYKQSAEGVDLNGACFVQSCGGTLILEGTLVQDVNFFGTFTANLPAGIANLDTTSDGDNYPAIDSIQGQGGFGATIRVINAVNGYFPNLVDGASFLFATTQQTLPFSTANPAACFSSNAITSCNQVGASVAVVGATNGLGQNVMLQTDASLKIVNATEIPEPATMTMLGLGLLGAAAARKFRSRKA